MPRPGLPLVHFNDPRCRSVAELRSVMLKARRLAHDNVEQEGQPPRLTPVCSPRSGKTEPGSHPANSLLFPSANRARFTALLNWADFAIETTLSGENRSRAPKQLLLGTDKNLLLCELAHTLRGSIRRISMRCLSPYLAKTVRYSLSAARPDEETFANRRNKCPITFQVGAQFPPTSRDTG